MKSKVVEIKTGNTLYEGAPFDCVNFIMSNYSYSHEAFKSVRLADVDE